MKVVKGGFRQHHKRIVEGKEYWDQSEPPEEMVWDMCTYTRHAPHGHDQRCMKCPRWRIDSEGDEVQRLCYGLAEGACRVAEAWHKRLGKIICPTPQDTKEG